MPLTLEQQRRYARQIMLSGISEAGQQQLLDARVLIIGAGGLGSSLIAYLAAAGVGHLGIIDDDRVELSNLARQIIHETGDIGRLKVESANDRVAELNPDVEISTYAHALDETNARDIIARYDIVADGCDNFETRFLVNKICVALNKPLVSAAIAGWQGQVMTIAPSLAPEAGCYQCFASPEAPEANTCTDTGIIGPLAGIIGSMQALEVINTILGKPALSEKLARYDGHTMAQSLVARTRDTACPICSAVDSAAA